MPVSDEERVNSFTTGVQSNPAITILNDGSFVVAWTSNGQDGSGDGVYAQRFAADGSPLGSEFRVATTTADDQRTPALTALSDGGFVITWQGRISGADGFDIYAQRFGDDGTPVGSEFKVNTTTASFQGSSYVAPFPDGGFLVTWHSLGSDEAADVYARRYDADGSPAAGEFRVNSFTTGNQDESSVAVLAGGGFVITWQSENQDGSGRGVYAQLYSAEGAPLGSEFRTNTTTANAQQLPAVAALEGGGFVIVWSGNAIRAQIYAADGTPVGSEINIAAGFNGVSVTAMRGGGFAVSWDEIASSGAGDGNGFGVVARAFNASGGALGEIVVVNETVTGDQRSGGPGSLGQLADGSIAFVWAGNGTDDSSGVFLRSFQLGDTAAGPAPIVGTPGDDPLSGTSGDDVIRGLGGNDAINGLGGTDVAEYRGIRSDYRITVQDGVYTIDDQREGSPDGTDTLQNMEQLRFGDGETVAIADAVTLSLEPGLTALTGAVLVNTDPEPSAILPMTVALTGGGYALVWLSDFAIGNGSPAILRGRAFDAAGQPVGDQFVVGPMDFLSEEQVPSLTALAGGGFAVAWMTPGDGLEDQYQDLQIQLYNANGVAGPRINGGSTARFSDPVLVGTANGGILVVREPEDVTDEFATTGQFYNASGTAVGSAFPIAVNVGSHLSAAILANGDIVMAWNEFPQSGGERAFIRLFSPTGQPRGEAFVVDPGQSPGHYVPSVASLAGGGFVVTWFHNNPDADIYGRTFDASGNPVTATFSVNEETAGTQWYGYVEALDDGGFVVSWTGFDGNGDGVFARAFDASGQPRGGEARINPDIAGSQEGEIRHLAQLISGDLIFSWTSFGAEVDGVFTRRFSLGAPPPTGDIYGTPGPDTLAGTAGDDVFYLQQGGEDTASGALGNDVFYLGAALSAGDQIDGGAGTGDQLVLQGNYAAYTFGGGNLLNVEILVLLPGNDARFGDTAAGLYSYDLTTTNGNVAAGERLAVDGSALRANETIKFNGSSETDGAFDIVGGAAADTLVGGNGNDVIGGRDGADRLEGGIGDDRVFGGPGNDTLLGGAGSDLLDGGEGNDVLDGGTGNDTLLGGSGNDTATVTGGVTAGGTGTVSVDLGDGAADVLVSDFRASTEQVVYQALDSTRATVTIGGLAKHDYASMEEVTFHGGSQGDIFEGLADRAAVPDYGSPEAIVTYTVHGGGGDDRIYGGQRDDLIFGDEGNDLLVGGFGMDVLDGGDGIDTVSYADIRATAFVNLTLGRGYTNVAFGDTYVSIENVIGSPVNDFIIGDNGVNRLEGGDGDDVLLGGMGGDTLIGGAGNDWASFEENAASVFVNLTLGRGYNNAAEGDTYEGIENLVGGLFDDFFIGDDQANRLNGAMGADTLLGAGGADVFMFTYAPGATSIYGSPNVDLILDFTPGEDKIELSSSAFAGLPIGTLAEGSFYAGVAAHDVDDRIIYDAATGRLWFDVDGSDAGAAILFATLGSDSHPVAIAANDFAVT